MKKFRNLSLIFIILLFTLAATWKTASAQTGDCHSEMVSATCTIEAGETYNGDISLVNSTLTLEEGARINGSISAMRSNLEIKGWLTGDLAAFLSNVTVSDSAHINGDLVTVGGSSNISAEATVNGDQSIISMNDLTRPQNWGAGTVNKDSSGSVLGRFIWLIFISLALAAIGLVAVLLFQKPADRMSHTIRTRPLIAFSIGLLFVISLPFAILLLTVTIILIPVVLAIALLLPIVIIFSWVTLGLTFSQWIASRLHWDWAPAVHAAVGTLALTFVSGLLLFIPCFGWVFFSLLLLTGLGSFVLLFFKTSQPAPAKSEPPAPPTPKEDTSSLLAPAPADNAPAKQAEDTPQEQKINNVDLFPEESEEDPSTSPDPESREEK